MFVFIVNAKVSGFKTLPCKNYTVVCLYEAKVPVPIDYLYCFREWFPFLDATLDVPPFYSGFRTVNGHRQMHTLRGIDWEGKAEAVPIVVVTHNRLTVLLETIRSFHRYIRTPFRISIHDEGSTYKPLLAFIAMLESHGVRVFRAQTSKSSELLSPYPMGYTVARIAKSVHQVLQSSRSLVYVVTDPDCALDSSPPFVLEVYKKALELMPQVRGVGAEIRKDDVSKSVLRAYSPLWRADIAKSTEGLFFFEGVAVRFVRESIDTTFCMYRRSFRFDRMTGSIRLRAPFGVRHLDYYFEPDSIPPDMRAYLANDRFSISHGKEYLSPSR